MNVTAQIPPVGGGIVDEDDDPNEIDDGLPDSILDPEDLITPTVPPAPVVVVPQTTTSTLTTVTTLPATAPLAQPSPAVQSAQPAQVALAEQPAIPPLVLAEGCTVVQVQVETPRSTPIVIEVRASGSQEVQPVSTIGSAFARFTFNEATGSVDYYVTAFGLSPDLITAAHIHRGAAGINGPIVHFISPVGFVQANGRLQLSQADVADLKASNLYFNIHSTEYPGGFARGQLLYPPPQTVAQIQCTEPPSVAAPRPAAPPPSPRGISPPNTGDGGLVRANASSYIEWVVVALLLVAPVGVLGWRRR